MKKKKKILSLVLFCVFSLAVVFSAISIIYHADFESKPETFDNESYLVSC